ncbi:hypothetical protein QFZ35_003182 [Arthrobacter ulcerisalmonis]|nr:competence protein CoiA family protein [Arthrobacter ulcerisalmonis]MDQ0664684.1 hypothetical protein [Arthrobacter ulcerisalmonis]
MKSRCSSSTPKRDASISATRPTRTPDGLRRHGETAEYLHGKRGIMNWARDQYQILPWSVEDEVWVPGVRLRSDVRATATSGRHLAFEVQRKPMDSKEWDRRHGGYLTAGTHDVWLWSRDVPDLVLDLPLTSVVIDMEYESLGVLVAMCGGSYRHPTNAGPARRRSAMVPGAVRRAWPSGGCSCDPSVPVRD